MKKWIVQGWVLGLSLISSSLSASYPPFILAEKRAFFFYSYEACFKGEIVLPVRSPIIPQTGGLCNQRKKPFFLLLTYRSYYFFKGHTFRALRSNEGGAGGRQWQISCWLEHNFLFFFCLNMASTVKGAHLVSAPKTIKQRENLYSAHKK